MSYEALGENKGNRSGAALKRMASSSSSVVSAASSAFSRPAKEDDTLGEPLNASPEDPYFVFRGDLVTKLDLVDQSLAEFLRVVHQTVSSLLWMKV